MKVTAFGKEHLIQISRGPSVRATDFQSIKDESGEGLKLFDPAYGNTAVVKSEICFIDGDKGILEYRGYPIEELAEKSTFLEVAYLLIYGELPTTEQYADWKEKVMKHTFVHSRMTQLMKSFNYDAHPMGMFISSMAAMSTFHPEANPALHVKFNKPSLPSSLHLFLGSRFVYKRREIDE